MAAQIMCFKFAPKMYTFTFYYTIMKINPDWYYPFNKTVLSKVQSAALYIYFKVVPSSPQNVT